MKISQIYKKLQLDPSLINHQYQVAAIASIICDNFKEKINKELVLSAALLHDVGYMVWVDATKFNGDISKEEKEKRIKIQQNYLKKYGSDGKKATYKILKEFGISQDIIDLIKERKEYTSEKMHTDRSLECLVLHYADLRVSPHGIVTISERLNEWGGRRFSAYSKENPNVTWEQLGEYMLALEPLLEKYSTFDLEKLSVPSLEEVVSSFSDFNILRMATKDALF